MDRILSPHWANGRLRLILSSMCNIDCYYCHNEGSPKGQRLFPASLFQRVLQLVELQAPSNVTFTGGEALLHPDLDRFASSLKPYCASLTLVTNGLLLKADRLCGLQNHGITKIRLGIDSLYREKSRPSRGTLPSFDPITTIDMIATAGMQCELNIVLTKFNIDDIPMMLKFCARKKLSAKVFEHVEVAGIHGGLIQMHSTPVVGFEQFLGVVSKAEIPLRVREAPELKGANQILEGDGFRWRYCRYLCPFGLCYVTGTRIDPTGRTYACMGSGKFQIISEDEPLASSIGKIDLETSVGCGLRNGR